MTHPLGDPVLLVPDKDPAPNVADLEAALTARDVTTRRVALGRDPRATVERLQAEGNAFFVHCGGQASLVQWLPAVVGTEAVAGVFPGGVLNDFARTFGLDLHPDAAATLIAGPRVIRVDVGVAETTEGETYVFNHAIVGLGAEAAKRLGRSRFTTLLGWYRALARHRTTTYDVDMTFAEYHGEATQIRLSNGQYAYGNLHAAPRALPDDGAWDVQVWAGPRSLPFTLQSKMVRAEHLPNEHVTEWRQKRAEVTATPPALVAVDDRVAGRTPATFSLLEKALRLKI